MNQEIVTKKCSKCHIIYPIYNFTKRKKSKDGHTSTCKKCDSSYGKKFRTNNPEKIKQKRKQWKNQFPEKYKEKNRKSSKKRTLKNPEYSRVYYLNNKDKWKNQSVKRKDKRNLYQITRRKNDINFKIACTLRSRMSKALKNIQKYGKTIELLGCDMITFRNYIEKQFTEGMSWDNYGKNGWDLDHIIPCAFFDLSDYTEQKICCHYTNYQPMWHIDNIKKSDKLTQSTL